MSDLGKNTPKHVAIIMDGNGRWAHSRGLPRIEGHRRGVGRVRDIVRYAFNSGVEYLTLFAFSTENWGRPSFEVNALMELLTHALYDFASELCQNEIRLHTIGDTKALPQSTQTALDTVKKQTVHFAQRHLVLALNYSARSEILAAVKRFAAHPPADVNDLSWDDLSQYLDTRTLPDPDLVIRTSGEMRMSNFLLLQSAYAEFIFESSYWPDFTEHHFNNCLKIFQQRKRRFGKIDEQMDPTTSPIQSAL